MSADELDAALEDLDQARRRYRAAFRRRTRNWALPLVPIWLNAKGIAYLWIGLHLLFLVAGGTMTVIGDPVRDLGFALVVGSLFAGGALGAQVFGFAHERETQLRERTLGPLYFAEDLAELGAELSDATARVRQLGRFDRDGVPLSWLEVHEIRDLARSSEAARNRR